MIFPYRLNTNFVYLINNVTVEHCELPSPLGVRTSVNDKIITVSQISDDA